MIDQIIRGQRNLEENSCFRQTTRLKIGMLRLILASYEGYDLTGKKQTIGSELAISEIE